MLEFLCIVRFSCQIVEWKSLSLSLPHPPPGGGKSLLTLIFNSGYTDHRPGIVKLLEEFKLSVFGENYEDNNLTTGGTRTEASQKRKAIADNATK